MCFQCHAEDGCQQFDTEKRDASDTGHELYRGLVADKAPDKFPCAIDRRLVFVIGAGTPFRIDHPVVGIFRAAGVGGTGTLVAFNIHLAGARWFRR